jgi:AraC family transcriptional regulator of adaptative response/methylated-DNA-[protein]-cysteine methyltransferase
MGAAPTKGKQHTLCAEWIDTKLGPMIAMADDNALWLLEFTDRRGLEREIERMRKTQKIAIVPGRNAVIEQIERELEEYFSGELKTFKTPLKLVGTPFQKSVWEELVRIPYGATVSYSKQAEKIGNLKAVRAVARANGCNQLAIIIPCHRVVGADGALTGYAGGLPRKKWLLEHEQANA